MPLEPTDEQPALQEAARRFARANPVRSTSTPSRSLAATGYSKGYPVEKLMRGAKLMQLYEGTNWIQRLVIARKLFCN